MSKVWSRVKQYIKTVEGAYRKGHSWSDLRYLHRTVLRTLRANNCNNQTGARPPLAAPWKELRKAAPRGT